MKSIIIYKGPYLKVTSENNHDVFVQSWETSPISTTAFKSELLVYVAYYKKYKPTKAIWLHQNFELIIDNKTKLWIEHLVNIPCKMYGNKKLAFVVCSDLLIHLSVIEAFDNKKSKIIPKHFATEVEARSWIDQEEVIQQKVFQATASKVEVILKKIDEHGNYFINVKNPTGTIAQTIKSFKGLLEEKPINCLKKSLFSSLTTRERQILFLYAQGVKHREISNQLFISLHTVRTHWKNVKRKLKISSFRDIVQYADAFQN